MKRDNSVLLNDIRKSISLIELFSVALDFDKFVSDEKTKSAVVRQFEIIGEAVNRLPDEVKEKNREIEWHKVVGPRNALIHGYFEVDYNLVWKTIKNDLPRFRKQIEKIN